MSKDGTDIPSKISEYLSEGWNRLMSWLHGQKEISKDSLSAQAVKTFIDRTAVAFNDAVDENIKETNMSPKMASALKDSNWVFSGMKVFNEMNEAFPEILDENGKIKPFNTFLNDVQKVYDAYNVNYLRTEYNYALSAAEMAGRWENFEEGDRYLLQYRTMEDERVRISHRPLDRITLPKDSAFWDKYFPPNGFGCRCTVAQVLRKNNAESDEKKALQLGDEATAGKYQKMFQYNAGKIKAVFPAYNPYTTKNCSSCKNNKLDLAAKMPDNELCAACKIIMKMASAWKQKKEMDRKTAGKKVQKWIREHEKGKVVKSDSLGTGKLILSYNAAKRFISHAENAESKWVLTTIADNVSSFENKRYSEIGEGKNMKDPNVKKNIDLKKMRYVRGYYCYEYNCNGTVWIIGTERIERGGEVFEQPYFIARK